MSEVIKPSFIHYEMQPDFPEVDLTENNAQLLSFQLRQETGIDGHVQQLQHHQRQIHLISNRALNMLGIKTRFAEEELYSFSHGFATFETISDMVHPPRVYNIQQAAGKVAQMFVDTRDFFEIELEELNAAVSEGRDIIPVQRDKFAPELELANHQGVLSEQFPNTYGVIVGVGASRAETMAQLHTRTAGAILAYLLQTK